VQVLKTNQKKKLFSFSQNPNHILQTFLTYLAGLSTAAVSEMQKQPIFPSACKAESG
jgi:hypothetical protein